MKKRIITLLLALFMAVSAAPMARAETDLSQLYPVPGTAGEIYSSQPYTGTTTWSETYTVYIYPVGTVFTANPMVGSWGSIVNVTNAYWVQDGVTVRSGGDEPFVLADSTEIYYLTQWNGSVLVKGEGPASTAPAEEAASEYAAVYPGSGYYITAKRYGNQELAKNLSYGNYFSDGLIQCGTNGGYGYMDRDGNVVISGETLDAIGCAKGSGEHFSEGLCAFRSTGGGYGYMDKTGRVVLQPEYSDQTAFHDGLALVRLYGVGHYNNPLRYIDRNGSTVVSAGSGNTNPSAHSGFHDGQAVYSDTEIIDGREYCVYNVIDRSGRTLATYRPLRSDGSPAFLVSPVFFSEGYAVSSGNKWDLHVFDSNGKLVWRIEDPLPGSYSYSGQIDTSNRELSGVHNGILIFSTGSTGADCKAVEVATGRYIFPDGKSYSSIYDNFSDGVAAFRDDGRGYGLVDLNGFEVVAPGEFSEMTAFHEGLAIAGRQEGKYNTRVYYLLEKHEGTWSGPLPQDAGQPAVPETPVSPETPSVPAAPNISETPSALPVLENFRKTETYVPFADVPSGSWYAANVQTAYELGLVKGSGPDTYSPASPISIAETLVLACRLHNTYYGSPAVFRQGSPWYQVYVDYAAANGILPTGGFPDYTAPANRQVFASIIANALPETALPAINSIAAGDIPDSGSISASILPAVLKLYNAGILTGSDAQGSFDPASSIQRSEVAAIVTRMAVPAERKAFSL